MKKINKVFAISGVALVLATTSLQASFDNSVYQNQTSSLLKGDYGDFKSPIDYRIPQSRNILPVQHPIVTPLATTSVVPEPTTMIAGALLLLPFGVSAMRIMRRKI